MAYLINNKTSFELKNGSELVCLFTYHVRNSSYIDDEEVLVSEPTYELDGVEVEIEELPKGLKSIAEMLYNNPETYNIEIKEV